MLQSDLESIARRRLLESIYDKMSREEKLIFVLMTMKQRSAEDIADAIAERRHREMMQAIYDQSLQIQDIRRHEETFAKSFASNIAGNAVWAGAEWLIGRLARMI